MSEQPHHTTEPAEAEIGLVIYRRLQEVGIPADLLSLIAKAETHSPIMAVGWTVAAGTLVTAADENGEIPRRPTGWGSCVATAAWDAKFHTGLTRLLLLAVLQGNEDLISIATIRYLLAHAGREDPLWRTIATQIRTSARARGFSDSAA